MSHTDPSLFLEPLKRLMEQETQTLSELELLLSREHDILARNEDVETLEEACAARQLCMGSLLRVQDERRAMLRMLGFASDPQGLAACLAAHDPLNTLRECWLGCGSAAERCRQLNDRNGALVMARMRRVEGMLGVLTGQLREPQVYGRQGYRAAAPSGRMLAAEA